MKNIILLIFILFSCNTSIKKNLNVYNPNELIVSKSSNISLLNRIRSNPGIYIEGGWENAKIYTKGITSINNQKEVLFILNGVQVGKFSQIVNILNPKIMKRKLSFYRIGIKMIWFLKNLIYLEISIFNIKLFIRANYHLLKTWKAFNFFLIK